MLELEMKRSFWHQSSCLTSGSQLEAVLPLGGHLTMSKDIFFIVMTGEAAAASKHHIIHRIALYNRESFSLLLER